MRALAILVGLVGVSPARAGEDPWAEAAAGVEDRRLAALLVEAWRDALQRSPETATALRVPGFDHRLSDPSVPAAEAAHAARAAFLERARRLRLRDGTQDDVFRDLFVEQLEAAVQLRACRAETWMISARMNPVVDLFSATDVQPIDDAAGIDAVLARHALFPAVIGAHVGALRAGLQARRAAARGSVERTVAQLRAQLAEPTDAWPIVRRVRDSGLAPEAVARVAASVDSDLRPAIASYVAVLNDEVLPVARPERSPGLVTLPDGETCYAARVRATLGPDAPSADELHALGLAEIARIHEAFRGLGRELWGLDDVGAIFARLRTDPALRFGTEAEIATAAEEALRRAEAAVPAVFGRLPATPCVVERIPAHEAPFTTIAYYRPPAADGSRPGAYFVNTHDPTSRPRHEAEVLAFHEAVPGHHTQIAASWELPAVPAFHRYDGSTAFVEGWALYAERLADELGLYSGPEARLGMLAFDAWRAARLVVDTGLHVEAWSRSEAERWMRENTPLAENNIVNEVDRYVSWPGQALAYKVGQLRILALRDEARAALGDRFRLADFHDVVLGEGAVPLDVLTERVRAWIARGGGPDTPRR